MHAFGYVIPNTLAEVLDQLASDPDGRLLAGGQTLLASLKLRLAQPSQLIDLSRIAELRGIVEGSGTITVGAMTRHAEVAASSTVQRRLPALAALAELIGDRMVRNRGTLGGSIANSDPAADYPAALLALDAIVVTTERRIPSAQFFIGMFETALRPAEIVVAVEFVTTVKAAYVKFRHPASRFALVGVFVAQLESGVRVAVSGAAACAFRVSEFEEALAIEFSACSLRNLAIDPAGLNADLHASAEYRANLIRVVTEEAIARMSGSARG